MYIREKVEEEIKRLIQKAVDQAVAAGDFNVEALPEIQLEVPREREYGEYSTNIAIQLPKLARKAPKLSV